MFPPVDFAIGGWLMLIMLPIALLVVWCMVLLVVAMPAWALTRVAAWITGGRKT